MRLYRAVAGVVALLFVFGPLLALASGVRPTAFENRPLAAAPDPAAGWRALDALAPWASDHLPGREQAVRAQAWVDYHVLRTLPRTVRGGPTGDGAGPSTPTVLRGSDGVLYLGEEFDKACADRGRFRAGLKRLARTARLIESSGRRVVFFVGPNKSAVDTAHLPRFLPSAECTRQALAEQNRVLDTFEDPRYLSVRRELADLAAAGEQPYWRTDTHWSTVGSAVLAERLAERLSPRLASRLTLVKGTRARTGDLTLLAGLDFEERSPTADVATGAQVQEAPGSEAFDETKSVYGEHRWTSVPRTGLVRGRTTIVGDSFVYFGLGNLRPLFATGEFLWVGRPATVPQIIERILASDTVVLETVQRALTTSVLGERSFYRQLKRALAAEK
ncbi:hypothetical protein KG112_15305 [Nocardioides sp. zg-ZUI104]|uniref:alginate O-acetyltransferase AlgX-related protein n=1 Tax=Nocardioides faecalis TaxID=2803858 RepID=UPI001BCD221A|nr:hypothetical protein [Nocardioides faecalis]MBS4754175.1 hypothetical protein [Nocardioides faecalis]